MSDGVGDAEGLADVVALAGAAIATVADTLGAATRFAALPVTVRRTDVTVVALAGTRSVTWSSRGAASASTVPSLQADVPSSAPQPKLKAGDPAAAGWARRLMVVSGRLPPSVQALTVQSAGLPRWPAGCPLTTLTQRLTWLVCCTGLALAVALLLAVAEGVGDTVGEPVGLGVGDAVGELVGLGTAEGLPCGRCRSCRR